MSSVSELVEVISRSMKVDQSLVSQYSRQLINAGLLPKSRGRAVASVGPLDAIRLILAVGLNGKYNRSAEKVREYMSMLHEGVPLSAPDKLKQSLEDRLLYTLLMVVCPEEALPQALKGQRHAELNLRYEIILNWPHALVHEGGSIVEAFQAPGALLGSLKEPFYKSFTLSGELFWDFDDLDLGMTPEKWAEFFEREMAQ